MIKVKNIKEQMAFLKSSRPKLSVGGVAKVLGISRRSCWYWNSDGKFDHVRKVKARGGTLFDMEDIFHLAYPGLDKRGVAQMMMEFRERHGGRRFIR